MNMKKHEQIICDQAGLTSDTLKTHDISLSTVNFEKGSVLFRPGDNCQTFLIVCTGSIKVEMTAKSGRDVTLYRINPSENCILTTSALMNNEHYYAQGVTESDITAIALSSENFYKAIQHSTHFIRYVLSGYTNRISSVIQLVDRMASRDVMLDVSQYLVKKTDENNDDEDLVISATQTQIANEIGTAREVVGRKLQMLETEEIVTLKRGSIRVIDIKGLREYAQI